LRRRRRSGVAWWRRRNRLGFGLQAQALGFGLQAQALGFRLWASGFRLQAFGFTDWWNALAAFGRLCCLQCVCGGGRMDLKIDHVTVCGRNLERMRGAFAEVGLATEYGGRHANGLTHMALAGFEDGSYLELIAPVDASDPALAVHGTGMMSGWMPLMIGAAGAGAWAVRAKGIHAEAERLRRRGIAVRGPERGGRTRPDGTALEWETALVGTGAAGSVLPFVIEDRTERTLRVRASEGERPQGFYGVSAVVIGVRDLLGASTLFDRAFGLGEAAVEDDAAVGVRLAFFSGTPVMLAEPLGTSWLSERLEQFGECPAGFVLAASGKMKVARTSSWFGRRIGWLDERALGARVGVVGA